MFRLLTIISFVSVVLVIAAARVRSRGSSGQSGPADESRFPGLEKLVAFVFWFSLLTLAGTGFLGATLPGRPLSGYLLLTHVAFGGALAGSLAVLAVFRAERYSFGVSSRFSIVQKTCFWVISAASLTLILSTLAGMLPVLGTKGQILSVLVHRCSALVALLAAATYAGMPRTGN